MANDTLSQALKEAYASAPSNEVVFDTIEMQHPAFVDGIGNPDSIWVVNDNVDLTATLEDGITVKTFVRMRFNFELPPLEDGATPLARLSVDNVSKEIVRNVELAVNSPDLIKVIYRPYLASDLSTPAMIPPLSGYLTNVRATIWQVVGTLDFGTLVNRPFPLNTFNDNRFPGLFR